MDAVPEKIGMSDGRPRLAVNIAAEDLAIAATEGGTITDGVSGYESTTGSEPESQPFVSVAPPVPEQCAA